MLTLTKKPTTEWTDVPRARELFREAVEARAVCCATPSLLGGPRARRCA